MEQTMDLQKENEQLKAQVAAMGLEIRELQDERLNDLKHMPWQIFDPVERAILTRLGAGLK
jgi:cell division protein FtsB